MPPSDQGADDGASPHPFLADLFVGEESPSALLASIVAMLDAPPELDDELCGRIGVGNLESLLRQHEEDLWDEVDELARTNARFRLALSSVWAYDSPMFERREALLAELRE